MPTHTKHLLVEDSATKYAVIELMRQHISWGKNPHEWPVNVEALGGVDNVLDKPKLKVKFKESELASLGLIVDADSDFGRRWKAIQDICSALGGNPPRTCPENGLDLEIDGKRFGVWIMPDNQSAGMIETFCRVLVPESERKLWDFAGECVQGAKKIKAPFKNNHIDKAHIHPQRALETPPFTEGRNALSLLLDVANEYPYPSAL